MPTLHKPNILLLCTSQQRFDSLGCYGNTQAVTPCLDGLAESGAKFAACYVQSTESSPSRATLFTGKYPRNHGLWANGVALPAYQDMFTRALADAGYDCGLIGRQHLSTCDDAATEARRDNDGYRVFDWSHGPRHRSRQNAYHEWLRQKAPEVYAQIFPWNARGRNADAGPSETLNHPIDTVAPELHYSHWVAERAIAFIGTERAENEPFFLIANFSDPQGPFGAPDTYRALIDADALAPPKGTDTAEKRPGNARANAGQDAHAPDAGAIAADDPREMQAQYLAMVAQIDAEVARILAALDASGQAEDTLVIFTSDHGEMLGDHNARQNGPMMNEGATRVPLILRWPGRVPPRTDLPDLVQTIDITATVLEAAGVTRFAGQQGQSLLPLIDGTATGRGWAFCEYRTAGPRAAAPVSTTMLRRGNVKLIVWHGRPATAWDADGELYDLANDPDETRNLFHSAECDDLREAMMDSLIDVLCSIEDQTRPRVAKW